MPRPQIAASHIASSFKVLQTALVTALLTAATGWSAERPHIVVDPGHGGAQEGAQGPGGVLEKHVALQLSLALKKRLESELDAVVFLTRSTDRFVPLSERVAIANKHAPDLFISVHANSMPTRVLRQQTEGIETFFLSADASNDAAMKTAARENAETQRAFAPENGDLLAFILEDLARADAHVDSSRFAHSVHRELVRETGAQNRGGHQAPFYVLTGVNSPAILVEVGYVSHPREGLRLSDPNYRQQVVDGIVRGTKDFLQKRSAGVVAAGRGAE